MGRRAGQAGGGQAAMMAAAAGAVVGFAVGCLLSRPNEEQPSFTPVSPLPPGGWTDCEVAPLAHRDERAARVGC
jgi:hypothetical protein